jgi:hypothetical protein
MACFGWVDELRRCACAGKCGCDLATNVTALPHSADNNSTLYGREKVYSVSKTFVDSLRKLLNGLSLNGDGSLGRLYSRSWRITV